MDKSSGDRKMRRYSNNWETEGLVFSLHCKVQKGML